MVILPVTVKGVSVRIYRFRACKGTEKAFQFPYKLLSTIKGNAKSISVPVQVAFDYQRERKRHFSARTSSFRPSKGTVNAFQCPNKSISTIKGNGNSISVPVQVAFDHQRERKKHFSALTSRFRPSKGTVNAFQCPYKSISTVKGNGKGCECIIRRSLVLYAPIHKIGRASCRVTV